MVCSVGGSTEFEWTQYRINPSEINLFAWLSQVALRFEKYRFKKLKFEYIPRCATTTAGSVSLLVDYDVADSGPLSKQELMNCSGAVSTPPWMPASMSCDRASMQIPRFVRAYGPVSTVDDRMYDLGFLYVAADGGPGAATVVGELYVEYEIELTIPSIEPLAPTQTLHTEGETAAKPLGDTTTLSTGNDIAELDGATGYLRLLKDFEGLVVATYGAATTITSYALDTVNTTAKYAQLLNAPGSASSGTTSAIVRVAGAAGSVIALAASALAATGSMHVRLTTGNYNSFDS